MESSIITLLSMKKNKIMRLEDISKELGVEDSERFNKAIKSLEEEGVIFRDKKGRYTMTSNTSLKKGKIKITKRKGPIVVFEDKTEALVSYKDHKSLENHDIVLVDISNNTAKVIKILKREYHDYIGEVIKEGKNYIVRNKDYEDIILNTIYPLGTKVLMDGKTFEVKEVLGHKDDVGTREKEILTENGFPISFSDEYLKELEYIPSEISEEEIITSKRNGVKDIRNISLVTIDGDDTKDFDDAVGVYNDDIYVSIANVANYIKDGTCIWEDTMKRGISVYPPGMVNPMLHHNISNGICSLIPGEDRFSVTTSIKLDDKGTAISYKVYPSIINSKKRMTYSAVNDYLENNNIVKGYEDYTEMLDKLYKVAEQIKNNMLKNGFLDFSSSEVKVILEDNKTRDIKKRYQGKAEDLIEFLMILHNLTLTDYFIKHKLPFIARNHDLPNKNKLSSWNHLLKVRGYDSGKMSEFSSKEISDRLSLYKDCDERVILDNYAIKSQSKAKYSAYNIGHFAIGVPAYATFSSPIRRCDLINQRILIDSIIYDDDYARRKWLPLLPKFAEMATSAERRADIVERKITDIRKSSYMEKYIGYDYDALVSEVSNEYIKVLLPNMIEGKVYISKYEYNLSKDGFSLYSNRTNERILVGDPIRVRLVKVDTYNGEIIFNRESYRENINSNCKKKVKSR